MPARVREIGVGYAVHRFEGCLGFLGGLHVDDRIGVLDVPEHRVAARRWRRHSGHVGSGRAALILAVRIVVGLSVELVGSVGRHQGELVACAFHRGPALAGSWPRLVPVACEHVFERSGKRAGERGRVLLAGSDKRAIDALRGEGRAVLADFAKHTFCRDVLRAREACSEQLDRGRFDRRIACDVPKGAFGVLVVEGVAEYAVHDGVEVSAQYLVGIFSVQVYHPRGVEPEKAPVGFECAFLKARHKRHAPQCDVHKGKLRHEGNPRALDCPLRDACCFGEDGSGCQRRARFRSRCTGCQNVSPSRRSHARRRG